jgi:methanethiol S-methyltransferase
MNEYVVTSLGLTVWAVLHSVLASDWTKRIARKVLGRYFLAYRLGYTLAALGSSAVLWHWLPRPDGLLYTVPPPWSWGLRLIQTAAIVGLIVTFRAFSGREFLGISQLRRIGEPDERDERLELNQSGLYGMARHPLYTLSIVAMIGSPSMTVWWAMLTIWAAGYFWIGSYLEECRMVDALGDAYREYQCQVPRFIPRLRRR